MARIQVLELPSVVEGENVKQPFALIIDRAEEGDSEFDADAAASLKESTGALALITVSGTLDVA